MRKLTILLLMGFITISHAVAQRTITGTVTDTDSIPLIGASIIADGTSIETATKATILQERQLELGFEGFFIYDIKRTNGMVVGLSADDPSLTLPIPQSEMDTNNAMEQNPGY